MKRFQARLTKLEERAVAGNLLFLTIWLDESRPGPIVERPNEWPNPNYRGFEVSSQAQAQEVMARFPGADFTTWSFEPKPATGR